MPKRRGNAALRIETIRRRHFGSDLRLHRNLLPVACVGDPAAAMAGESVGEDIEYVRKHYGFDRPLPVNTLIGPPRP